MTTLLLADHDNKTLSAGVAKAMSAAKALGARRARAGGRCRRQGRG